MADAISTLSMGDGFLRGFNAMGQHHRNKRQEKRIDALEGQRRSDRREDVQYREGRASATDALASQNFELRNNAQQSQEFQNQYIRDFKDNEQRNKILREKSRIHLADAMNGGDLDMDFHKELKSAGMSHLSPISLLDDDYIGAQLSLGPLLAQLEQGNLEAVNTEEGLYAINQVYAEQITRGVGERAGPTGKLIKSKELSRLEAGPNGKLVALAKITYDDGTTVERPITLGRSSDHTDPVKVLDPAVFLDDAKGRYELARMAMKPEIRGRMKARYEALYGLTPSQKSDLKVVESKRIEEARQDTAGGRAIIADKEGAAQLKAQKLSSSKAKAEVSKANTQSSIELIRRMLKHSGRSSAVGKSSVMPTMPGTNKKDYELLVDRAKSGQFVEVIQQMRGLGQLSNAEGKAATLAATSLDLAQTEEAHEAELRRLLGILEKGLQAGTSTHSGDDVVATHPDYGNITVADIQETMRVNNLSREEVLQQLGVQ